jgi:hypothetical protein
MNFYSIADVISVISKMFGLNVSAAPADPSAPPPQKILSSLDIDGIADYIKSGKGIIFVKNATFSNRVV